MFYVVEVGYNRFYFDSIIEATTFATTAKEHFAGGKYSNSDTVDVTIEIGKEDEQED